MFKRFTNKEKREHYGAIVKGQKSVKKDSKFSEAEQKAYARGQLDVRNEIARKYAAKNSTPLERAEYARKRAEKRLEYLKKKGGKK